MPRLSNVYLLYKRACARVSMPVHVYPGRKAARRYRLSFRLTDSKAAWMLLSEERVWSRPALRCTRPPAPQQPPLSPTYGASFCIFITAYQTELFLDRCLA